MAFLAGVGRPNPYFEFGPRPFREQRVAAYVVREHRRGRRLDEILEDRYLALLGSRSFCWAAISRPSTIATLARDAAAQIAGLRP